VAGVCGNIGKRAVRESCMNGANALLPNRYSMVGMESSGGTEMSAAVQKEARNEMCGRPVV